MSGIDNVRGARLECVFNPLEKNFMISQCMVTDTFLTLTTQREDVSLSVYHVVRHVNMHDSDLVPSITLFRSKSKRPNVQISTTHILEWVYFIWITIICLCDKIIGWWKIIRNVRCMITGRQALNGDPQENFLRKRFVQVYDMTSLACKHVINFKTLRPRPCKSFRI